MKTRSLAFNREGTTMLNNGKNIMFVNFNESRLGFIICSNFSSVFVKNSSHSFLEHTRCASLDVKKHFASEREIREHVNEKWSDEKKKKTFCAYLSEAKALRAAASVLQVRIVQPGARFRDGSQRWRHLTDFQRRRASLNEIFSIQWIIIFFPTPPPLGVARGRGRGVGGVRADYDKFYESR